MEGFDSNYRYVLVAARRARQLLSGARPMVETHSRKPSRVAMEEIAAGKVNYVIGEPKAPAEAVGEILDPAIGRS